MADLCSIPMDIDPQALWRGIGVSTEAQLDSYLQQVLDDDLGGYLEHGNRAVFTSEASHLRISVYVETDDGRTSVAFGIPLPRRGLTEILSVRHVEPCSDGFLGIVSGATERGISFSFYDPFFFLHPDAYPVGATVRISLSALGLGWGRIAEADLPPPLTLNSSVILPTDWNPAVVRFFGRCPRQLPAVRIRRWNLDMATYSLYLSSLPGPIAPALDVLLSMPQEERPLPGLSAIQGQAVLFGTPEETSVRGTMPPEP
jgi:hypothetical protein